MLLIPNLRWVPLFWQKWKSLYRSKCRECYLWLDRLRREGGALQGNHQWREKIRQDCSSCDKDEPITPCGACRQVLSEFASDPRIPLRDLKIICANLEGKIKRYTLKKLLPEAFEKFKKNFPTD